LIADVRGYTSFTQQHGDEQAGRLAERFAACTRECVDVGGGNVLELRGDEALCVFSSPRQALRTAITLQRAYADATRADPSLPLFVGIGVDAGEAVAVEGGYRGGALNLAARLCSLAGPGEVLAAEGVVLMAGQVEGLTYADRGRVQVKGVREPVRVRRLQFDLDLPAMRPSAPPAARWKSRRVLAAAVAVILLASAAVAALIVTRGGHGSGSGGVAGDSVGLLDATSGKILSQFPVGATPVDVVSDDSAAWTLDADAQTISRVEPDGGRPLTKSPAVAPTGIALGGGSLWVAFVRKVRKGTRVGVAALDPSTLALKDQELLPVVGPKGVFEPPQIAWAGNAVWLSGPLDLLRRIDPDSLAITDTLRLPAAPVDLAVGLDSLWATAGEGAVLRVDPKKRRIVERIPVATPVLGALAVGAGSLWAADPLAGLVWRIDPGPPRRMHTVRVGLRASGLAFGQNALWAAGGVDGRVARIDPTSEAVESHDVGNAPQAMSVSSAGVWTAVAASGGRSIAPASKIKGLEALPAGTCSAPVYGGLGSPDALIVSDLPMQRDDAPATLAMVQAIEFVLRKHGFRAGPHRIAFQACDDATALVGTYTDEKCAANAESYAAARAVIGVIGPLNSGCATAQIATANSARPGPLAMISPTNSYIGLTRKGVGVQPGDPDRFYRTGIRNYARVYPADDAQGAAQALLAKRLGVRRAFVFLNDPTGGYSVPLAETFAKAAGRLGIRVDGPASPGRGPDRFRSVARRLRSSGTDAVVIAGLNDARAADFIRAARAALGRRLVIIAPEAFIPASERLHDIGPAASGMYVSGAVVTDPVNQLPPEGRAFVREFGATQRGRTIDILAPYAAQAAEVLLKAIARSDGTRASVTRELLRVRIAHGILGSIAFDKNGDLRQSLVPIFRARPAPGVLYPEDPVFAVLAAPVRLAR
jgi:branched-chain amino acid transport system substrate-binding protein